MDRNLEVKVSRKLLNKLIKQFSKKLYMRVTKVFLNNALLWIFKEIIQWDFVCLICIWITWINGYELFYIQLPYVTLLLLTRTNKRNYPNRQFQETYTVFFFMSNDNETTLPDLMDINIKILNADYITLEFH